MIKLIPTFSPVFRNGDEPNPGFCIEGINFRTFPPSPYMGQRVIASAETLNGYSSKTQSTPKKQLTIVDLVHPEHVVLRSDWLLWRLTYKGGRDFVHAYLSQFSNREDSQDFEKRKRVTPVAAFAKAGINDVKNQVTQALSQIVRRGGSDLFLAACAGENGGVDLKGSSMTWFMSSQVLPELMVMQKVAIYVDSPAAASLNVPTSSHPYIYTYIRENIWNWSFDTSGRLTKIVLRDYVDIIEPQTGLPLGTSFQFRFLWKTVDNTVGVAFFDADGTFIRSTILAIPEIPVHIASISTSLIEDVANHQVAIVNMESSDVASSLKAGFPIYVEQRDSRFTSSHLKQSNLPPEVRSSVSQTLESDIRNHDQGAEEILAGPNVGRIYGAGMEQPDFISPPMDPMEASMAKQEQLKQDIRILLNLSLANLKSSNVSGDAKILEQQGTEAGFAALGRELEHAEKKIAEIWASYQNDASSQTEIIYPLRYAQEADSDRLDKAAKYAAQASAAPSAAFRKAVQIKMAEVLLMGQVSNQTFDQIVSEIEKSQVPTSDATILAADLAAGLVSSATASSARGYPSSESEMAAKEHLERVKAIAAAQIPKPKGGVDNFRLQNPNDRGVPDLAANPSA